MYYAYITRLKNVRPHSNADRLKLGDCFGNTVVVSLEYEENQLGVYFPSDISGPNYGQYRYDVIHPITGKPCPTPAKGW